MALKDLREYIKILEKENFLTRIPKQRSIEYEIPSVLKKYDGEKAVFIEAKGYKMDVVGNLCCSRDFIAKGLNIPKERIHAKITQAAKSPLKPTVFTDGPAQDCLIDKVNLRKDLPILKHYERDGGPYITSSIIIVKDPETKRVNASYHRMLLVNSDKLVPRIVEGRDLHSFYLKSKRLGKPLEAAVVIGAPLELLITASMSYGSISELDLAGGLTNSSLEVVKCNTIDIEVPRHAEIILEGTILLNHQKEGPFVDITGSYDIIRDQPIFQVNILTRRKDAFYQAILSGGFEHQLLMGMPKEAQIYDRVQDVSSVSGVALTPAGSNWLDAAISIKKKHPNEPYLTAMAAIAAHYSLKRVVIVDEDVDVTDLLMVEKAVLERAHPVEDYFVINNIMGSTLDKSVMRFGGKSLPPAKIIIDATIKDKREFFEFGKIPQDTPITTYN